MNKSRVITIGSAAAVLALTAGTASAATMITSHDIQDGTVRKIDLSDGVNSALTKGTQPGTAGAIYRVAHYATAGTGAIASVACADNETKSQKYVAVSGGVQIVNADGDNDLADDADRIVADSFPGRMHWATGDGTDAYPKPDRLDGWVVRFGSEVIDSPVNVWAVCMPKADDVQVQTTNY